MSCNYTFTDIIDTLITNIDTIEICPCSKRLKAKSNVKVLRPGNGLLPKYYEIVLGKIASQDIKAGTPISWDNI